MQGLLKYIFPFRIYSHSTLLTYFAVCVLISFHEFDILYTFCNSSCLPLIQLIVLSVSLYKSDREYVDNLPTPLSRFPGVA
jgi:hypothetical protein